ncbi:hypothetical protein ANCDUO_04942 [Ancylostoma duodenale]|uniref:Uncharacterized protein n=1 Tax=Ancylostoma duodenale TaxID=51022 RepID=A0A0C2GTU8_9BILA|nr:hypothetical protein ANCDUO_04942 [Ancylostoma duodenale]
MLHIVVFVGALACASAQYGAQPVQNDNYHQAPPPLPPPPPNPVVIGVPVAPYRSSSSEWKSCGSCDYLKTNCKDVPRGAKCYQATIKNFIDDHGCKVAILSCGRTKEPVTLETSDGEKLGEGIDFEKVVRCGRNERWCTRNIQDNSVSFRTVRCIVSKTRPPRPHPHPPHPRPPPPPRPQPIAE